MTPRPGRITATLDIDHPRELDAISTEQFGGYVRTIRTLLNARGMSH